MLSLKAQIRAKNRAKNRAYYQKECLKEYRLYLKYRKTSKNKNNANIHLKNSYHSYDQYTYNGGGKAYIEITKSGTIYSK